MSGLIDQISGLKADKFVTGIGNELWKGFQGVNEHNQKQNAKQQTSKLIYNNHGTYIQSKLQISNIKSYPSNNLINMSSKKSQIKKSVASKKASEQLAEISTSKTLQNFWNQYSAQTHPRIKVIDLFMLLLTAIIALQIFYVFVVGDDFPRNAAITGIFAPGGVIILLAQMRKSGQRKNFRKLAEFFIASLVLFVVSINFIG